MPPENTLARYAALVRTALRQASGALTPQIAGGALWRERPLLIAVGAILAANFAVKLAMIWSGAITLSRSDGASRLFVAIDRFGDSDYFSALGTWTSLPLPAPQLFYAALYGLDRLSNGALPVTLSVLSVNAVAFAGALACFAYCARRIAGPVAAVIFALLAACAYMPNFVSATAAVEPLALLFFSVGMLMSLRALSSGTPFRAACLGALALMASTTFRYEFYFLAPIFSALLYARLGAWRCAIFTLIALSYMISYQFMQALIDGSIDYSQIRKVYTSIRPLTVSQFLNSALFESGIRRTWGAPILAVGAAASIAALFIKQYRLLALLGLTAVGLIVFAAMTGRITSGQPRYAVLGMLLCALPLAALAADALRLATRRLAGAWKPFGEPRLQSAFYALIFVSGGTLSAFQLNQAMTGRSQDPPPFAQEMATTLLARIAKGESAFFDYGFSQDFAIAVRATTASRARSYSYLSRCCVSQKAGEVLGAEQAARLTQNKGIMLAALSLDEKLLAQQIWAHGFIDRYRPAYFLIQTPAQRRRYIVSQRWPADLASTITPFSTPLSDGGPEPGKLNITLAYAPTEFTLTPIQANDHFILYRAAYPAVTP